MKKRCMAVILAVLTVISAVGCGNNTKEEGDALTPALSESLETIYAELCEKVEDEETREFIEGFGVGEINAENAAYYIGSEEVDYKEAIYAEPMMSSIAFSVCLVRVNEGADIEAQKKLIAENVNPIKWLCVEAETVVTENIGDVILMVMADSERAEMLKNAFEALNQ